MNKRASIGWLAGGVGGGGVAGLVLAAVLATDGRAADHLDSPTLAGEPLADITDVFAWMSGTNLNLVMGVSPADDGNRHFGPGVQYVFHVTSKPGLGLGVADGAETRVICTFASDTRVQCWVTDGTTTRDYATGDPSTPAGLVSTQGKLKVFAGPRSDPAFFNRAGLEAALARIKAIPTASLLPDEGSCPTGISQGEADQIRTLLTTGADAHAASNVMALVIQLDRALVTTAGNPSVAVWGASHAGS